MAEWKRIPGPLAKDIGVGSWGAAWIVSRPNPDPHTEGFIHRRVGQEWRIVPRATPESRATRIAVAPEGRAWAIMSSPTSLEVYTYGAYNNGTIALAPLLQARLIHSPSPLPMGSITNPVDIGVGAIDTCSIVASDEPEKTTIFRWGGFTWQSHGTPARRVAVEPNGTEWRIRTDGRVIRDGSGETPLGSAFADDIGVGGDGRAWIIRSGINSYWDETDWKAPAVVGLSPLGAAIAVSPEGIPWIVDHVGFIYRLER